MKHRELRETFHHDDSNHDGSISLAEFGRKPRRSSSSCIPAPRASRSDAIDTDGNHVISFEEFVAWWDDDR